MTVALTTPPTTEPLTIEEIKYHLRIDHDHEDALLQETLKASRRYVEFASGRKLITQGWRQYETKFPENYQLQLRVAPVRQLVAITAFDGDGEPSVVAADMAELVRGSEPACLRFSSQFQPALAECGLEVDLIVGMGDLGVEVDEALKRAILLLVAHWYEFRGSVAPSQQPVSLPAGFEALMALYARVSL